MFCLFLVKMEGMIIGGRYKGGIMNLLWFG